MVIDPGVYQAVNVLLKFILWSLIISSPLIIATLEMYAYEKYKKWKDTEVKDKEKIIVGKAKETIKHDEHINWQKDEIKKLDLELELLGIRKKSQQLELGIPEETEVKEFKEQIDLNAMKRTDLLALCKERGFTMYSRKNKKQLIKILE